MTNFDFLKNEEKFASFADVAINAEKIFHIDAEASALNCRRAAEFAVKWMYSADLELEMPPYDDSFAVLTSGEAFRGIVKQDNIRRLDYIRRLGNNVAHKGRSVTPDQVRLCLENLFYFLDCVAYLYADEYEEKEYDRTLPDMQSEPAPIPEPEIDIDALIAENTALREELSAKREEREKTYSPPSKEPSEYETRTKYIDVMLMDAGWELGKNWINEYPLSGMPNASEFGFADYVLFGDDGVPLAVVEAKRTCVDLSVGRRQAQLYADLLEKKFHKRPIIFLTNGFETRIWDDRYYPERAVSGIYSKRDLEKLFNLRRAKTSLKYITVDKRIAGRYYQEAAIKSVCEVFERNRRKALLVMATGSGKTRTVVGLVKVLLEHGWIKNVLFLADRTALVTQAKRTFVNLLEDFYVSNLCETTPDYNASGIFSTYQTMMNAIDEAKNEDGRIFSCGHFDLIVLDEAHRSVYNKYHAIFEYFDAPLVGLTATPKNEVGRDTYSLFELEENMPTYGYDLPQAVTDGYLVNYQIIDTKLKFMQEGIVYDDLSEEEKEAYESTFTDENGELPAKIVPSALNDYIFNEDTIRQVLRTLMTYGQKIDYGQKIGKTIIFAKNHQHAETILRLFNSEYPEYVGYAAVIDNYINYAQNAIDVFSTADKLPQIAISVDMLDTGIDIPEILNLVIFKPVLSKAKFWQMIGRGTRLCPELLDGKDKTCFYVFDFCGVCEFFGMGKGKEGHETVALQSAIFNLKAQIIFKLQDLEYQTDELIAFRKRLVAEMLEKVQELDKNRFDVKLHLRYVEKYCLEENYTLQYEDTLLIAEHVSPLILPDKDEVGAIRFDALMYGIELAYLIGKSYSRARNDLMKRVNLLSGMANIPEIMMQAKLLQEIRQGNYLEMAGVNEFENIRENLRDLMKYLPKSKLLYTTDFKDAILSLDWKEPEFNDDTLKNYKIKAEQYVRRHEDDPTIAKLKTNVPLTQSDIQSLEKILWNDLGSKAEYEAIYGEKPLGEFVREIVGLDMATAKKAFAEYLNETRYDSRQIYFVNQIIEYIVHNGVMKDLSVLQSAPFSDRGSIIDLFRDASVWFGIKAVIDSINANALAA